MSLRMMVRRSVRVSVAFYDQYGNTTGKGATVNINIDGQGDVERTINSRGTASLRVTADADASDAAEDEITVGIFHWSGYC